MKLVIEDEAGTRTVVPFTGGELVVGRGAQPGGLRLADRDVSRRHARFLLVNGAAFVEDLGSLTGTRVNGERITARRRLREGDLVEIGGYDLAVIPDEGLAAVAGPGAPPPLPRAAPPVPDGAPPPAPVARTPEEQATDHGLQGTGTAANGARHGQGRLARFVVACLLALALGLVMGWVVGQWTH